MSGSDQREWEFCCTCNQYVVKSRCNCNSKLHIDDIDVIRMVVHNSAICEVHVNNPNRLLAIVESSNRRASNAYTPIRYRRPGPPIDLDQAISFNRIEVEKHLDIITRTANLRYHYVQAVNHLDAVLEAATRQAANVDVATHLDAIVEAATRQSDYVFATSLLDATMDASFPELAHVEGNLLDAIVEAANRRATKIYHATRFNAVVTQFPNRLLYADAEFQVVVNRLGVTNDNANNRLSAYVGACNNLAQRVFAHNSLCPHVNRPDLNLSACTFTTDDDASASVDRSTHQDASVDRSTHLDAIVEAAIRRSADIDAVHRRVAHYDTVSRRTASGNAYTNRSVYVDADIRLPVFRLAASDGADDRLVTVLMLTICDIAKRRPVDDANIPPLRIVDSTRRPASFDNHLDAVIEAVNRRIKNVDAVHNGIVQYGAAWRQSLDLIFNVNSDVRLYYKRAKHLAADRLAVDRPTADRLAACIDTAIRQANDAGLCNRPVARVEDDSRLAAYVDAYNRLATSITILKHDSVDVTFENPDSDSSSDSGVDTSASGPASVNDVAADELPISQNAEYTVDIDTPNGILYGVRARFCNL